MEYRIVLIFLVILLATVSNDGSYIRRGSLSNKASRRLANDDDGKAAATDDGGGSTDDATSKPTHKPTSAPLDDDEDDDDDFVPTHRPTTLSTPSSRPTSAPSISFEPTPISMNPSYTHAPTPSALLPTAKTFAPTHHPIGPSTRPTKHPTFSPAGKSTSADDDAATDDDEEVNDDDEEVNDDNDKVNDDNDEVNDDNDEVNDDNDEEDVTQDGDDDTGAASSDSLESTNFFKSGTFYLILSICLAAGSCIFIIIVYFCYFRAQGKGGSSNDGRYMKYDKGEYLTEETSLLSEGLNGPREISAYPSLNRGVRSTAYSSNSAGTVAAPPPVAASSPPSSRIYFRASDLEGQVDNFSGLLSRFTAILSAGLQCNLHTTKGPKPILLSMIGFEVRWQAVKSAQKRYKLHLRDVIAVEVGKRTSNFQKSRSADDNLCYSLVTQKTTLDLEATSKIERDSLVKGFQICLINLKNSN